jgi:hypothetical protein
MLNTLTGDPDFSHSGDAKYSKQWGKNIYPWENPHTGHLIGTTRPSGLLCHKRYSSRHRYSQIMFGSILRSLSGIGHTNNTCEEPRKTTIFKQ